MANNKSVYIPRPLQSAPGFRLHPTSKHAKGRAAKAYKGQVEFGNGTTGAFGGAKPSKRVKKTPQRKFLREANYIHGERALKAAYAEWRAGMSPEELAEARRLKVHQPADANGEFGKPKGEQVDVEFHDPAELPEASITDHPIDRMEPQSPFAVAIASLGSEEITAAADCFSDALTWALDIQNHKDLVTLGRRALLMILRLRPDLVQMDGAMHMKALEFTDSWAASHYGQLGPTGQIFGRVLEWVRRGDKVSAIGERLALVAYVVRPAMIDSPTLEELGETMNKTGRPRTNLSSACATPSPASRPPPCGARPPGPDASSPIPDQPARRALGYGNQNTCSRSGGARPDPGAKLAPRARPRTVRRDPGPRGRHAARP